MLNKDSKLNYIYVDESVCDDYNFVVYACVFLDRDPNDELAGILMQNSIDPECQEYHSRLIHEKNSSLTKLRHALFRYLSQYRIAIAVTPNTDNGKIEFGAALSSFLIVNNIEDVSIFLDRGIVLRRDSLGELNNLKTHLIDNCDSKKIRGIQLADLVAHTVASMTKQLLKPIASKKYIKTHEGLTTELDFELFCKLRYIYFSKQIDHNYVQVEPFGLYLSNNCQQEVVEVLRSRLAITYIGCVH